MTVRRPRCTGRVAALLAVATLGTALTGCQQEPPGPASPTPDALLSVDMQARDGELAITYTVANRGAASLVVFNGLPARDGQEDPAVDRDRVYVTRRTDGTVEIAKRVFPAPAGAPVEFVLRATPVIPGERITEEVRVPLPPRAEHPYERRTALPGLVQRVVFCVGYARQDAVTPVRASAGRGDIRPIYAHNAQVAEAQTVTCGTPVDVSE